LIVFFTTYVMQFLTFALIYLAFRPGCVVGINGSFAHALWMSSRTASTLGFNQIYPDVTCVGPNLIVMLQVGFVFFEWTRDTRSYRIDFLVHRGPRANETCLALHR
jgi:hypothetical protein